MNQQSSLASRLAGTYVLIQRNPKSGRGTRKSELLQLIRQLKRLQLRPLCFKNRDRLDRWISRHRGARPIRCIVAAGGDGTAGDLVNRHPDLPLAVFPLGTENLLARYLGITRSGHRLAQMIHDGHVHRVDVGLMNDRRFLLMVGVGIDGEVVQRVDAARTGPISRATYFAPLWRAVRQYRYPQLRTTLAAGDGTESRSLEANQVVAVNINRYAMGLQFAPAAADHDGLLDVVMISTHSWWETLRALIHFRFTPHAARQNVVTRRVAELRIESEQPVPVQVDGDPAGFTPINIRLLPAEQTFVVPAGFGSSR